MTALFPKGRLFTLIFCFAFWMMSGQLQAQLTGIKTIPGDYATVAAAVTALNAQGVGAGGVTFNVASGHTEVSDVPEITATGTAANPIVFQKSGALDNPLVTKLSPGTVASSTTIGNHGDGIIVINGGDYITFDGIDVKTDASFAGVDMMEYGYYLKKASGTDACKNVTIKNCAITLNKTAVYSFGVFVSNISGTTTVTVTSTDGRSENVKIFNNTISNCYGGVQLRGFAAAAPYDFFDQNIEVGEDGENIIFDFGGGGSAVYGIYTIYQNNCKLNNNTISGGDGTTTTLYGIFANTSNNGNYDINNNSISLTSNSTTSQLTGIYTTIGTTGNTNNTVNVVGNTLTNFSRPSVTTGVTYFIYNTNSYPFNLNIQGNIIGNSSFTGTGAVYGIYQISIPSNFNVFNNIVSGITSGGIVGGIHNSSSSPGVNIYKNKIFDLTSTTTGTSVVSGILQATLSGTGNIYNNLIGDLKAPTASATVATAPSVRGINITSASANTTLNVSYNTVHLDGTSSGTNFGTAALFATGSATATSTNLVLKNNIFVNNSTPVGVGLAAAYQRSSTSLANYDASSNNNLFYAGAPSPVNLIFYDGTNSDQTLGDFQGRVAPRENASISENPTFLSTSGGSPDFLHMDATVPTAIESGGMPVSGITEDFDGNIRNATTPDIGGDEFAGILGDGSPPSISYTPLANTCTTGAMTLTATITDPSGVPTAGIGLPVLYWSINLPAGPFSPVTATWLGGDQYQFTFGGSAVLGDEVYYYIVAQDNKMPTPNVGSSPTTGAGGFTANPPAATTPPSPTALVEFQLPFIGTYTVGAAGNYPTLSAAVSAYNNALCMTGPVVFSLIDGSYPSEIFPITINENPNASAANTLTIRPAAGNFAIISGSSASCIIRLNGADHVILDGSNSGGTDRSMAFENTSPTANSAVICVSSLGNDIGATNNTIKNISLFGGEVGSSTTLHTYGIHVAGTTITNTATGADNDNLTIQNNAIKTARYGIYARGASVANANDNLMILNNEIGSPSPSEYVTFRGIDITNAQAPVISGNTIRDLKQTLATNAAIDCGAGVSNGQIVGNLISGIYSETTTATGFGAYGINFSSGTNVSNNLIANNFITDIRTVNFSSASTSANAFGIRLTGGTNTMVYYNSINLFGDITIVAGTPTQPNSACLIVTSTAATGDVKNNIFRNVQTFVSGTPKIYSVWAPANYAGALIDNNVYYGENGTGGNSTTYHVGRIGTTDYTDLAAWKAYTLQDFASIQQDPNFLSNTDLHINPAGTPVESGGTPIAGITTDFDGNTRNISTPDIGADEGIFTLLDLVGPGITYSNVPNSICTGTINLDAGILDASGVNTSAGTKPRLWFKKSSEMNVLPATNTSAHDGWKYVEATNASSPFSFVIDYSLLTSAVVSGDLIQYFVVAQDMATTPNVGTNTATYNTAPTSVALGAGAFPVSGTKSYSIINAPVSISSQASPDQICISGDVTLSLTGDASTGAEYQWESSPAGANTWSPISGANTPTYVVTGVSADTDFRCVISCGGTPIAASPSAVATVDVSTPMVLGTTPGAECGPGPVSVALAATASGGADLNWYDVPTGGTSIFTGANFNTPPISTSTTYYVAASAGGSAGSVGPINPTIGTISSSNIAIGTQRMFFDVLTSVTILSVDIFPTAAVGSNGTITIRDNTQTVLANVPYTTTVTGGNVQTVPMNVTLAPGTAYEIGQGTAIQLNRNTTGAVYPYTSAAINITGNTFDPVYYYFFYNWQWATGCESPRTPVTASILPVTTWYADSDTDTYGNTAATLMDCVQPNGYVADNTDCDDTNAAINPAAAEICNNIDDDCSGSPEAATNNWNGLGNGTSWDDAANWSDDIVPLTCQHVVIPATANVTIPAAFEGKGLTLEVATGAILTMQPTALLHIINP